MVEVRFAASVSGVHPGSVGLKITAIGAFFYDNQLKWPLRKGPFQIVFAEWEEQEGPYSKLGSTVRYLLQLGNTWIHQQRYYVAGWTWTLCIIIYWI